MIKTCLIGAGRMGRDHAKHIQSSPDATLYSVVDPNKEVAETVAFPYEAKVFSDPANALSDPKVDAVVIASNTATHADLIILAAKAGKPIFCEKPIDLTLERTDSCLEVVERLRVPLLIGFNRRFDPSFQHLKAKLEAGVLGTLEQLSISSRDLALPSLDYLKTSGGMFRDMTIHDFDMARWLLQDEPVEIYATGSCLIEPELSRFGDVDTSMVVMKTAKGMLCHIFNTRRSVFGYDQRIEVSGEKGMLNAENLHPTTVVHSSELGIRKDCPHPSFPQRYQTAYQLEIDHFFRDVVKDGKKPLVSGEDARQALVIAEAAAKSYQTGAPISIAGPRVAISQ